MRRIFFATCVLLWAASLAMADTVHLRDGRTVRGTVLGFINGRFVVRVGATPATGATTARPAVEEGEVQFLRPADIERIELDGRSLDEARFKTKTTDVQLAANWIDTGVDLRRGERVQVKATGTIVAGRSRITPDGLRATDPTAPLPRSAEGVLIGAISNEPDAPIIEIGLSREFVADRDGRLYLTANRGTYTDARGAFNVQVRTERDLNFRRRGDTAGNRDPNRDTSNDDTDVFADDDRRPNPAPVRSRDRRPARTDDPFGNPNQDRERDPNRVEDDRDRRQGTPREVSINVPANVQGGTDTGVDLRAGDRVTISASGTIVAGQKAGSVSPEGGRAGFGLGYPFPSKGPGALLGFIRPASGQGQAQLFFVGTQLAFDAPLDGRLFLIVNDDRYTDNSGNFTVQIRY